MADAETIPPVETITPEQQEALDKWRQYIDESAELAWQNLRAKYGKKVNNLGIANVFRYAYTAGAVQMEHTLKTLAQQKVQEDLTKTAPTPPPEPVAASP